MIKFRAWKKVNTQEMFNDVRVIDFDKRIIKVGYQLSRDTTRIDTESLDNVVLMQSTGLKDKNGVEIYEGDIIEFDDETLCYPFDDECAVITTNRAQVSLDSVYGVQLKNFMIEDSEVSESNYFSNINKKVFFENYEIIGNIYKHSYMLEEFK
ncbi:YopX family protein [Staphylococcus caprae]|uniref:YopX family protein n=1 Tax=Staphylococcus caprae TaxID=29380 RepID=UPI0030C13AB5